jgi:hypothetical protein
MHRRAISAGAVLLGLWSIGPIENASAAEAQRWRGYVHLNGYSHHFAAPGTNANILGTGVTWYTRSWGRVQTAWEADVFQDSAWKLSGYAGHSWTMPFRLGSVGATGALMYHRNFEKQCPVGVLPVILPFAETTVFRNAKLRAYYIPPLRNKCDEQVAFQLLIPFRR